MELQLYLDILRRHILAVIVVVAIVVAAAITWGMLTPPVYTARTTVRVLLDVGVADFRLWEDYNSRLLNTYAKILKSRPLLETAIERLPSRPVPLDASAVYEKVAVEVIPDTELLLISVQDENPVLARDLANTLAELLIEYAQDLYVGSSKSARQIIEEQLAGLEDEIASDRQQLANLMAEGADNAQVEALGRQITSKEDAYNRLLNQYELARLNESLRANSITIITPATVPASPTDSFGLKHIGLALVVGLFSGLALALILENLDTRIHDSRQLERLTRFPVLGAVPEGLLSVAGEWHNARTGSSEPVAEAYYSLAIYLQAQREQALAEDASLQTILITSAGPGAGKSAVAVNLAQVLAALGQAVLLVDCDLRRPAILRMIELEDKDSGLGSLLTEDPELGGELLDQIVQPTRRPGLFVLSSGARIANPLPLLASPFMRKLLDYLSGQDRMSLLAAPPALGAADVSVLAPKADGVILVVRQAYSRREQVAAALKQLQASRARVLGAVFVLRSGRDWGHK